MTKCWGATKAELFHVRRVSVFLITENIFTHITRVTGVFLKTSMMCLLLQDSVVFEKYYEQGEFKQNKTSIYCIRNGGECVSSQQWQVSNK